MWNCLLLALANSQMPPSPLLYDLKLKVTVEEGRASWLEVMKAQIQELIASILLFSCLRVLDAQSFSWPRMEWVQEVGHMCIDLHFFSTCSVNNLFSSVPVH